MFVSFLRTLLAHPLTASLDVDDPATTELRKQIISSKPFLKAIYDEWYATLAREIPAGSGAVLELGSGAGYCHRFIPGLITSEIIPCSGVCVVANAQQMPFAECSLRAIVMTNVLHHMPCLEQFFAEASRCLRPGGKILMIEPWVTWWSRWVYTWFHHEPFDPSSLVWSFPSSGPLSGANGALPWIVLERDRDRFQAQMPNLLIDRIRPFMPFRYLVSGGLALRSMMPGFTHSAWAAFEEVLESQMSRLGMFAFISIRKTA